MFLLIIIGGKFAPMKQALILFFATCISLVSLKATTPDVDQQFSDKVNLALRQVGHHLLKLAGDDHSTIAPVEKTGHWEYTLFLEHKFNYDTLPYLLNKALIAYDIKDDYQVTVKPCEEEIIILGYNRTSFESGDMGCKGREQESSCSNIIVTFIAPVKPVESQNGQWLPWFLLAIVLFGFGMYWRKQNQQEDEIEIKKDITLGQFSFDPQNQILKLNGHQQTLTFRENKLLYCLTGKINEVVTRDTLIAEVWGDEGVIVGRSLDVFISRLRKLLKEDDSVMIKNIHGVGYRLEVGAGF